MSQIDMEQADEMVILDVTRDSGVDDGVFHPDHRRDFIRRIHDFTENLFLPLSVGGHVNNSGYALDLLRLHGADKIVVNAETHRRPEFITELAKSIGGQSVVVSIDVKDGTVWTDQGTVDTGKKPENWAYEAQERGAGEIYLMDIDRDGSLQGYNYQLLESVLGRVSVPVVIAGGCRGSLCMDRAFSLGADGAATANIFHFTPTSMKAFKENLRDKGHEVRL